MLICHRCGKGMQVGMNVSHSHVRTKKRSKPNLHTLRIHTASGTKRVSLCTKCLRIVKKEQKELLSKKAEKLTKDKSNEKIEITIPM